MFAFVETDSSEHISEAVEVSVVALKGTFEGFVLEFRVFMNVHHVLMLGVVLELGIEHITHLGANDVEQPANVVVEERNHLRNNSVAYESLSIRSSSNQFLQDE